MLPAAEMPEVLPPRVVVVVVVQVAQDLPEDPAQVPRAVMAAPELFILSAAKPKYTEVAVAVAILVIAKLLVLTVLAVVWLQATMLQETVAELTTLLLAATGDLS